jgi:putative phosphoribosyl transferase
MSSDREVMLELAGARVGGRLCIPPHPRGLVVFAHGSGSSRHSPRNRYVADVLDRAGYATLLFDLLTPGEALDRARVFDIDLLAGRLIAVTNWARHQPGLEHLPIGYFGASTGAAAALCAAADADAEVAAVVSRGGRPDLAGADLRDVRAPTLLIVGGLDSAVIDLNEHAMAQMRAPCRLEIVPGATHLFEEPGTLKRAARLAAHWFDEHLAAPRPGAENDKRP